MFVVLCWLGGGRLVSHIPSRNGVLYPLTSQIAYLVSQTIPYKAKYLHKRVKSCLVKGDTKDYQVSARISLEIPLSDFSMGSQNVLTKDYQRLLKIMWITTFKLSLLCHCIIQETN